jgi:TPR repeat protein
MMKNTRYRKFKIGIFIVLTMAGNFVFAVESKLDLAEKEKNYQSEGSVQNEGPYAEAANLNGKENTSNTREMKVALEVASEKYLDRLFEENDENIKNLHHAFSGNQKDLMRKIREVFVMADAPHSHPENENNPDYQRELLSQIQALAATGNAHGLYILGVWYLFGENVSIDFDYGQSLIKKAADAGDSDAAYGLAQMYEIGLLVPLDFSKAVDFYRVSANAEKRPNYLARNRLGELYESGIGVAKDFGKAMYWYGKASEESSFSIKLNAISKFNIGRLYAQGKGVSKNYQEAASWFLDAVNNGNSIGGYPSVPQCALTIMYFGGVGVEENMKQAEFWLHRPGTSDSRICQELSREKRWLEQEVMQ